MTSGIQRPSGSGPAGPAGPSGPDGSDGPEVSLSPAGIGGAEAAKVEGRIAQMAEAMQAGSMRPEDALAELLDGAVGDDLDPELASELREMMHELIANDPYLASLAREVGAMPGEPGASDE